MRRKSSRDVTSSYENSRQIILDRTVAQMNLQDGGGMGDWIKCRLVLVGFQNNYQIEVYSPPKVSEPCIVLSVLNFWCSALKCCEHFVEILYHVHVLNVENVGYSWYNYTV